MWASRTHLLLSLFVVARQGTTTLANLGLIESFNCPCDIGSSHNRISCECGPFTDPSLANGAGFDYDVEKGYTNRGGRARGAGANKGASKGKRAASTSSVGKPKGMKGRRSRGRVLKKDSNNNGNESGNGYVSVYENVETAPGSGVFVRVKKDLGDNFGVPSTTVNGGSNNCRFDHCIQDLSFQIPNNEQGTIEITCPEDATLVIPAVNGADRGCLRLQDFEVLPGTTSWFLIENACDYTATFDIAYIECELTRV